MKNYNIIIILLIILCNASYAENLPKNLRLKVENDNIPTIYVDVKLGSDKFSGSFYQPYKTIQKAAKIAKPGDIVLIKAGVYKECVDIKNSGTSNKKITYIGEKDSDGSYKTIIDPSVDINEWVPAFNLGSGIYKANIQFEPKELTVDNKRIGKINEIMMSDGSGFELLAYSSDKVVNLKDTDIKLKFWDGVEALYGYKDSVVYIKFRDEKDPGSLGIKASFCKSAVQMKDISNVVIKNLYIKNSQICIFLSGTKCFDNEIANNYLTNGIYRVLINDRAYNNKIYNNTMTMNYIAPKYLGAGSLENDIGIIKRHVYKVFKFIIGKGTSNDAGIRLKNAGDNNEIFNNTIYGGLIGITGYCDDYASLSSGLKIYENTIHDMSSVGITSSEFIYKAEYFNNLIYNCNINIRMHRVNSDDVSDRSVYIYKNKLWNPPNVGYHFYVYTDSSTSKKGFSEYYIYHNNFSGGKVFLAADNGVFESGGMPSVHLINNIISTERRFNDRALNIISNNKFGMILNNWIGGKYPLQLPVSSSNHIKNNEYFCNNNNVTDYSNCNMKSKLGYGINLIKGIVFNNKIYQNFPGIDFTYYVGNNYYIGADQCVE